jgi:hypothetical protein
LTRDSSLTSRSRSLIRYPSAVVTPSRMPLSISCQRTQSYRVGGTQPILAAMDSVAAHSDGCSPRCSRTIRTACSRTSGKNFGDLPVAPSSQELEPPHNRGRFNMLGAQNPSMHHSHTNLSSNNSGYRRDFLITLGSAAMIQDFNRASDLSILEITL